MTLDDYIQMNLQIQCYAETNLFVQLLSRNKIQILCLEEQHFILNDE
jgi:hypothetical protein